MHDDVRQSVIAREFRMVTQRIGLAATAVAIMATALISFAAPI